MTQYFLSACLYLAAAIIAVLLCKRLGLGSVLGYLVAGVVIGPITGLVGAEASTIQHFAEFGVVMMLFLVGLELEPKILWQMRHRLFGLGGLQVAVTTLAFTGLALLFAQPWQAALAIGLILSLSSTAIVLQTFNEKKLGNSDGGRAAFSVLLFQDIAFIPMLAVLPLLAVPELMVINGHTIETTSGQHGGSITDALPYWAYGLVVFAIVAGVVFVGHYLSRPLFRMIANSGLREMFTAAALLLIIGIAALMNLVALSPALGTFLAGVMLANSEFRHELEADIEPFKGLLLGLFFITVGVGLDLHVIGQHLFFVVAVTLAVITIKACLLFGLATLFSLRNHQGWLLTLSLAQAGEFGFVLLSFAGQNSVLPADMVQLLSTVVALSMFFTPVLFFIYERIVLKRFRNEEAVRDDDPIDASDHAPVIIAGIGRFGQIVNRFLLANGVKTIVLDNNLELISRLNRIHVKPFYGDPTRPDLLHTAGIAQAKLVVIAIDDIEKAKELVRYVKHSYPQVKVFVRAYDRPHVYALEALGADYVVPETFYSAAEMAREALESVLGLHRFEARHRLNAYLHKTREQHDTLKQSWLKGHTPNSFDRGYVELFIELEKDLAEQMRYNDRYYVGDADSAWMPPPKTYVDTTE